MSTTTRAVCCEVGLRRAGEPGNEEGSLEQSCVVSTRVVAGKTSEGGEEWQTRSCASCGPERRAAAKMCQQLLQE